MKTVRTAKTGERQPLLSGSVYTGLLLPDIDAHHEMVARSLGDVLYWDNLLRQSVRGNPVTELHKSVSTSFHPHSSQ